MQAPAPSSNIVEFSVSELAFALKRTLEDAYGLVRVRGEISGFKRAASGHLYFSMKDEKAVLDAVCWRGTAAKLAIAPEDGLEVICTGRITTYPGRSRYQIVVDRIEPAGAGALMALLEERKKRLAAEGLFDEERKRPIPFLPELIGIVTSPTGSVIRDMLHRLGERFPRRVILWPVAVQGEGAAEQIAGAIAGFDRLSEAGSLPRPDVLIVARGGGSLEDLWSFNEEVVARAVAACTIPVISAVGHETDTTLIDHVADRRAPTPTAAAEIAVPVRRELLADLNNLADRQLHAVDRLLKGLAQHVQGLGRGLPEPRMLLGLANQRLDDLGERLRLRTPLIVLEEKRELMRQRHGRIEELVRDRERRAAADLKGLAGRLSPALPERRAREARDRLAWLRGRLDQAGRAPLETAARRLESVTQLLESLSHERVLERGYALIHSRPDGRLVTSLEAAQAAPGLEIEFRDGRLAVRRANDTRRGKSQDAPPPADQGRLL